MTLSDPQTPLKPPFVRPPKELRSSTAHLLKRLGWAIKDRSIGAYEATGLSPYHHAVLAVLDEGPPETQAMIAGALGHDRSPLVGPPDPLRGRARRARRAAQ